MDYEYDVFSSLLDPPEQVSHEVVQPIEKEKTGVPPLPLLVYLNGRRTYHKDKSHG